MNEYIKAKSEISQTIKLHVSNDLFPMEKVIDATDILLDFQILELGK